MKTNLFSFAILAAFTLLLNNTNARAQALLSADVPRTISYQGLLANNDGKAVPDGNYQITLSLYADPTGTVKLWQETYNASVADGIFNLYLGAGNVPLPDPSAMNASLWIGTRVGDEPEMVPLTPLSASPYALNVPDRTITTGKLADGAVTAEKVDMDYISGIAVNGQPVTAKGTVLNLEGSTDIALSYNDATNTLRLSKATAGNADGEKGTQVLDVTYGTSNNWLGRDAGANQPFYAVPNSSSSTYNTLGGGYANNIQDNSNYATIVGGRDNVIDNGADYGFIGSGLTNNVQGSYAAITGGQANTAAGDFAFIAGGIYNIISAGGEYNAIGGGGSNIIFSSGGSTTEYSGIASGINNGIGENSDAAAIAGGNSNNISDNSQGGFIGGGMFNQIWVTSEYNTIVGGGYNSIYPGSDYSAIGGGERNEIGISEGSGTDWGTIGGGIENIVRSDYGTIGGGQSNIIVDSYTHGTIGGGLHDTVQGTGGTIAGGIDNYAGNYGAVGGGSDNKAPSPYATIGGGYNNEATSLWTTIGGGYKNNATQSFATVAGGDQNTAAFAGFVGGGASNTTVGSHSTIGGGLHNTTNGNESVIPGGDNLQTTGYGQTAVGYFNASRGLQPTRPSAPTTASLDDPLFMVGNGDGTVTPAIPSNAFEVSYNGHSVVYGENGIGTIRPAIKGATFTDNIIYAWADVNGNGTVNSNFATAFIVHLPGSGLYTVTIRVVDPQTGTPLTLNDASITATIVESSIEPEASCAIITTSRIGTPGPNQFIIRTKDVDCRPMDAAFMFKVTGRP